MAQVLLWALQDKGTGGVPSDKGKIHSKDGHTHLHSHPHPHPQWGLQSLQKYLQSLHQLSTLARFYVHLNPVSNSNLDSVISRPRIELGLSWCSIYIWRLDESHALLLLLVFNFLPSPNFNCNWLFEKLRPKGQIFFHIVYIYFSYPHFCHPAEGCQQP